jgi:hypothetical protein
MQSPRIDAIGLEFVRFCFGPRLAMRWWRETASTANRMPVMAHAA